jgi:phage terminase small subunit
MMGGRNGKPITLQIAQGNPNRLTKAEIERRKKAEIKIGETKLKCPEFIKKDINSYAKWKEITKIYKDIDFVSSGDIGLLARYCMTFSEYISLLEQKQKINNFEVRYDEIESTLDEELVKALDCIVKFNPAMQIDSAINKKMDMLIKMEDRLFLNPLSKIKNVPKKEKEPENPLKKKGFGNV